MTSLSNESESDDETSDSVDSLDYTSDPDDLNKNESFQSLDFNLKSGHTAMIKSKKSNKRVRFKPGNSMVLVYIIPNREMLGLKSESEDSDDDEIDEDNENDGEENEDDDDDVNDTDTDDESDTDDEDNTDDEDDDKDSTDDDDNELKDAKQKSKPFAKVLAVKQVCRKQFPNLRSNRKSPEQMKMINLDILNSTKAKKCPPKSNKTDKKDPHTTSKKVKDGPFNDGKCKVSRIKKKIMHPIKQENKAVRHRQRRSSRILEIRATVETASNKHESLTLLPKVANKHDIKPTIVDINGTVGLNGPNPPGNRNKLQPISVKVSKPDKSLISVNALQRLTSASVTRSPIARVVSESYESSTSSSPHSYLNYQSFDDAVINETINRLDPGLMNAKSKRNYAWQIANGTISSQSLRTPCILPFWDSLQSSVTEHNTIKLPA